MGCLLYLSNTTRPDLSYSAGLLSRHMHAPKMAHWKAAKGVLRYLKGTKELGICYEKGGDPKLSAYSDSDWGQEKPERKSISGHVFLFAKGAVSWRSKKQSVVAQSTVEAQYIALSFAIREAMWLWKFEYALPYFSFSIFVSRKIIKDVFR